MGGKIMVNINPNRESCMEYMKELIRQKLPREEVIEEWEKQNKIEIHDKRQDKINLKYQIYKDQKAIYTNKESSIDDKEKAMNILLSHFLKRVE